MPRALLALLVVLFTACGQSTAAASQTPPANASPSGADAATVAFRNLVDSDFRSINRAFDRPPCGSRKLCLAWVAATRAATETLLSDLDHNPAPPSLTTLATKVRGTASAFVAALDDATARINQPSSNYQAVANGLSFHDLDLAVAAMDCWPKQPVNPGNEGDYTCA